MGEVWHPGSRGSVFPGGELCLKTALRMEPRAPEPWLSPAGVEEGCLEWQTEMRWKKTIKSTYLGWSHPLATSAFKSATWGERSLLRGDAGSIGRYIQ